LARAQRRRSSAEIVLPDDLAVQTPLLEVTMKHLAALTRAFLREEEGASLVEYALLVALIGVAAIAGMKYLATQANSKLTTAGDNIANGS
jgi:pilus assembly protein Flp/PilA